MTYIANITKYIEENTNTLNILVQLLIAIATFTASFISLKIANNRKKLNISVNCNLKDLIQGNKKIEEDLICLNIINKGNREVIIDAYNSIRIKYKLINESVFNKYRNAMILTNDINTRPITKIAPYTNESIRLTSIKTMLKQNPDEIKDYKTLKIFYLSPIGEKIYAKINKNVINKLVSEQSKMLKNLPNQ